MVALAQKEVLLQQSRSKQLSESKTSRVRIESLEKELISLKSKVRGFGEVKLPVESVSRSEVRVQSMQGTAFVGVEDFARDCITQALKMATQIRGDADKRIASIMSEKLGKSVSVAVSEIARKSGSVLLQQTTDLIEFRSKGLCITCFTT